MPHSKREIGFMKKHMAHVLILEFYEEHGDVLDNVHHGLMGGGFRYHFCIPCGKLG